MRDPCAMTILRGKRRATPRLPQRMKTESADYRGVFLPLEPQLHKPNRGWMPGRRPGDISQTYGQRAEGSFPGLGPIWEGDRRRWALRSASEERFPRD